MNLSLVVMTPGNKMEGKELSIKLAQFLVGRDPQCHLRPASPLISKRHCALIQREGKAYVRDFNSTNGTFVNDVPVQGEVELHGGDKLKIGPLLFSVNFQGASTPVNQPTPPPPTRGQVQKPAAKTAAPSETSLSGVLDGHAPDGAADTQVATRPAMPPAAKPGSQPAPQGNSADDDVAAMLLALQDEGALNPGEVPDGSTVHDVTVSPDMLGEGAKPKDDSGTGKADKHAQAKAAAANTSAAAESILKKYMRRSRKEP
jgi:predicted component of type VI protein secretion system